MSLRQLIDDSPELASKSLAVLRGEVNSLDLRRTAVGLVAKLLPDYVAPRLRARMLGLAGAEVARGATLAGWPTFAGANSLRGTVRIGRSTWVNIGAHFELNDTIDIGSQVHVGHNVLLLTLTHEIYPSSERRAGRMTTGPIVIGDGCWLGANVVVLPGVTIGKGAVVAAGAVVTRDVPPDTLVGGVPAQVKVAELPTHAG